MGKYKNFIPNNIRLEEEKRSRDNIIKTTKIMLFLNIILCTSIIMGLNDSKNEKNQEVEVKTVESNYEKLVNYLDVIEKYSEEAEIVKGTGRIVISDISAITQVETLSNYKINKLGEDSYEILFE